uniref:Uncharacterized protein n=1 Tax=Rhizophora mucronata TaxID=61149 RepID=A0A2P2QFB3_RHIMU
MHTYTYMCVHFVPSILFRFVPFCSYCGVDFGFNPDTMHTIGT